MTQESLNNQPDPKEAQEGWIASEHVGLLARVVLMTGVALMIGVSATVLFDRYRDASLSPSSGASSPASKPASSR